MSRLITGVQRFMDRHYPKHKETFEKLADSQTPHTLFIGCSDSMVVPNLLTDAGPGELFVVRNIANIVPPFHQAETYPTTVAAIHYALEVLKVGTIVVCGHSDCGGCKALIAERDPKELSPQIGQWLALADSVKETINATTLTDPKERAMMAAQHNVVLQLTHLKSYPQVEAKLKSGDLEVLGWYYQIDTGKVYQFDPTGGWFTPLDRIS